MVSAAFNARPVDQQREPHPAHVTLDNFKEPAQPAIGPVETAYPVSWFLNSIFIATVTAFFTVIIGALAAYAFCRFRFQGRRMGLLFLLLIQMFPQLLMLVAIYLIVLRTARSSRRSGSTPCSALGLVYLGGAMGVNAWLIKGFFDTIPHELDESARVDGATAGQIFWGVILPLATPVLAVVGLFAFVGDVNEFVIASASCRRHDKRTLPVGLQGFIDQQYGERWGPFAAGVLLAAIPACSCSPSCRSSSSAASPRAPSRDDPLASSPSRTTTARSSTSSSGPLDLGDEVDVRLRVPRELRVDRGRCCATSATASRAWSRRERRRGDRDGRLVARDASRRGTRHALPVAARRRRRRLRVADRRRRSSHVTSPTPTTS